MLTTGVCLQFKCKLNGPPCKDDNTRFIFTYFRLRFLCAFLFKRVYGEIIGILHLMSQKDNVFFHIFDQIKFSRVPL